MSKGEKIFIGICILVMIILAFLQRGIISEILASNAYKNSIVYELIKSFTNNLKHATLLTLFVTTILTIFTYVYMFFARDPLNVIRLLIFIPIGIGAYVFISVLLLLTINKNNAESIIALLGLLFGLTKYLPFIYDKIRNGIDYA
ncbi:hypothetical protein ACMGE5_02895 [Macrococcus equi]|uniref:hypothetical protein n=1 Tax=Macrococcus equi TaxID=3395462 RepID=UPI0039BE9E18